MLGEALGEAEARMSKPFCGDAGLMLGQVLHRLGYKREHFLIANRTNCRPPQNWMEGAPWEADAVESCRPFFDETLRRNPQIKVLVPMGNSAMHYLLGHKGIANFHGYVQWHPGYEKWVVPTFHPSYLMRGNWNEIATARFDIQVAVELAQKAKSLGKDAFQRTPVNHLTQPSVTAAWEWAYAFREAWLAKPDLPLASDIETPKGSPDEEEAEEDISFEIERISFAHEGHRAISMPWEGEYIEVARWLYALGCTHWLWNGDRFDLPRLRRQGCQPEHTVDIQELWHFIYPDLPKKLGYVAPFFTDAAPWKHLKGVDEPFYSCEDSARLWAIGQALVAKVKADGRWPSFEREILECNKRTAQMSRNGIAIDEPVRVAMVKQEDELATEVHLQVQDLVPRELKPIHPKGGYKQPSPEGRCVAKHKLRETCEVCHMTQGWDPGWLSEAGLRQVEVEEMAVVEGRQQVAKFVRWAKVEEFNINSGQQLIRYIEFALGKSAVPKAKRTGKPTVERDQLERLAKKSGDPVLLLACKASEIQARVSHLNGWAPGTDGKVHAVFTNQPATFRLAAKNPNVFNFPTRSEAMHAMRRMVIPGPGYAWIVSRDYSGIEAIQVGIYAGDPDYERLAKFGIHTFMAARKAKLDVDAGWPDDQLKQALKEYKKVTQTMRLNGAGSSSLYDAMKRGNHMTNYGATANMLQASYPDVFATRKAAQQTQDFIFDLFPKIKRWQDAVVDRAHREAVLVNDFGYPRWFWFVKKPVKKAAGWSWERAEDAKAAIATLPQSSAAIILRRALTSAPAGELLASGKLFLSPHDELIARAVDDADAEHVSEQLRLAMEAPVAEQGGRVFKTAAKMGHNWAEVE